MKYKVGDKVRVRKDLKIGEMYGKYNFCIGMKEKKGKIFTIGTVDEISYNLKGIGYVWTDEMLEPVEEIIEYKGKKYDVKEKYNKSPRAGVYVPLWENDLVLSLKEHKEEILDEAEKEYLRNVIKYVIEPTHNKICSIEKQKELLGDKLNIIMYFNNDECIYLPLFDGKRMYKGMELDKEYTLEDLGLN